MAQDIEKFEKAKRAERLKQARIAAGFKGPGDIAKRLRWNANNYKAHESGRNGFTPEDAKRYANAFGVSINWLMFGTGTPDDKPEKRDIVVDVPLIPWISAGQLTQHETVMDLAEFNTVSAVNLPAGDWIAFRVDGNSMNKISPPDSIIFANRRDTHLVPNGLYVVADETGAATYKRYRPNERPPFQPASFDDVPPPSFEGAVTVIGRVRRSIIDM